MSLGRAMLGRFVLLSLVFCAGFAADPKVNLDVPTGTKSTKATAFRDLATAGHEHAAVAMGPATPASGRALSDAIAAFEQALRLDALSDAEQLDVLLVLPVLLQRADAGNAKGEIENKALPLHARAFAVLQEANTEADPDQENSSKGHDDYTGARAQMLFNYAVARYYIAESKVEVLSDSSGTWVMRRVGGTAVNDGDEVAAEEAREHLRHSVELLAACPAAARAAGQPEAAERCEDMRALVAERLADLTVKDEL